MYLRDRELLTSKQRTEFTTIPADISNWELASYYTLSDQDLNLIQRRRRDHNRLGFATQLCLLRFPGRTLSDVNLIPHRVLKYIADQIQVSTQKLQLYAEREQTKYEHLEEIRTIYGYSFFSMKHYRQLSRYLLPFAMENTQALHLIKIAIEEMRKQKIILPAITTVERLVWETRHRAENKVYQRLTETLTPRQRQQLNALTEPYNTNQRKTPLSWLREKPGQSSPDAFLDAIKRLEYVREINLSSNIKEIHPNRLLQLSRLGERYEPHSFRRFNESKKHAILVAYLLHLSQELIDQAIEIHDRQIMVLQAKGRKAQEELQKQHGKSINEKIIHFADLGAALIKAKDEGLDPFKTLEDVMPWENFISSVQEARKLSRPIDFDYLDLLENRFSYLRKYTPTLLNALEFQSNQSAEPLMEAIHTIRTMNESGKRRVPETAPLDFISNRWQKHVYDEDGTINRRYYEMAALTELRNHIRSGDISVSGSRQYKNFDEYLISKEEWMNPSIKNHLAVSQSFERYISERVESLSKRLNWISNHVHELEGVNIGKGKIQIERLEKNTPEEAKTFSLALYKMLPKIKLTDLLLEVASWTGFDESLVHASSGHPPKGKEKSVLMATIMAMGTNIGLTKMADATPDITYHQMANIAQWRMHDDAMNKAQAALVDFQHQLALPSYWGDGTTSSSDGMRVQVGVPSLYADANPHYGHGKGTTFYRFTSDQFSTFSGNVVNTNSRDALHVVDGLLHHESELNIEEHYTDTAGYTDQVFGLCHLLGFKFAPRLRDLADTRLHIMGKPNEFPKIESLLRGRINTKIIRDNYDDVLRMGQSVGQGKVSAALILGKLGSYSRQNQLATALREMGRIEKTIFVLDYISTETIRRRVQRGLNKGEAMNALARALFFGKRGELRERALQDQMQRNSSLNILINAISVWNTVYLTEATKVMKNKGDFIKELMAHVSPLGWEHINFLGEYTFDLKNLTKTLRPLNI